MSAVKISTKKLISFFRLFAVAFSIAFDFLSDYHDDLSGVIMMNFA